MTKYYDLAETAEILGVPVRTLRQWQRTGYMTCYRYEGRNKWYVSQEEIERIQNSMQIVDNTNKK